MTRRNKRTNKWLLTALLCSTIVLILAACGDKSPTELKLAESKKHPLVTMELSTGKTIKIELYPEVAPNTVNNMISLIQKGFYDGKIFHRVIPNFMIQAGELVPEDNGQPDYTIKGEFNSNKFTNLLEHKRGVISTARIGGRNDSASSQFFIMVADNSGLDGEYAAYGAVIEGMEAADEVAQQPRDSADRPKNDPIYMTKVTVDLKGMKFPEPDVIR